VVCHNQKLKTANLLLDQVDLAHFADHRISVKKLSGSCARNDAADRHAAPGSTTREALITWMEQQLDSHATTNLVTSGHPPSQPR
jgi:hypothetical protein